MERRKRFVKGSRHKSSEALKKQHDKLKNLKKEESRSKRKIRFPPNGNDKRRGTPQGKIRKSLSFIGMAPFSASHVISNRML